MKRVLWFLLKAVKLVALWLWCFVGGIFVLALASAAGYFIDEHGYHRIAVIGAVLGLIAGNAVVVGSVLYYRYKTRNRWVQAEANRWLARRSRQPSDTYQRRKKLVRRLLWIPSLVAMVVFLFLPEAIGIVQHLSNTGAASLNHHRIQVPLTWCFRSGGNYLVATTEKGIGRVGPLQYWRGDPPISEMRFFALSGPSKSRPYDEPPERAITSSRRTLPFGMEMLTCWEIVAARHYLPPQVSIQCTSSMNDFIATFEGRRADVSGFYDLLERATETK
jgi:hypothetical protein